MLSFIFILLCALDIVRLNITVHVIRVYFLPKPYFLYQKSYSTTKKKIFSYNLEHIYFLNFKGIYTIYKNNVKIYQTICF